MSDIPKDQDHLTEEETAKRRDEIARRMLNTPPKPHKPKQKPAERPKEKKTQDT